MISNVLIRILAGDMEGGVTVTIAVILIKKSRVLLSGLISPTPSLH